MTGPIAQPVTPPAYRPTVDLGYRGVVASTFRDPPRGVILHGSRSGAASNTTAQEYLGTARYAVQEPGGLGWNASIGSDIVAIHMPYSVWGWNARGCSPLYIGVEFAQAVESDAISDGQVRAFCWFFQQARKVWPALPLAFPTHAELDGSAAYGSVRDGKTDVFSNGSGRTVELRDRIIARLQTQGIS